MKTKKELLSEISYLRDYLNNFLKDYRKTAFREAAKELKEGEISLYLCEENVSKDSAFKLYKDRIGYVYSEMDRISGQVNTLMSAIKNIERELDRAVYLEEKK